MGKRNVGGIVGNLGARLKTWRKKNKMKGFQLAEKLQISQASISEIENGKSMPSCKTLQKLCELTNMNIIWLLVDEGPMEVSKGE